MYAGARLNSGTGFHQIVAGRSGSVIWEERVQACAWAAAVRIRTRPHNTTATNDLLRAGTGPVIDS
jgi:hypothetical protein